MVLREPSRGELNWDPADESLLSSSFSSWLGQCFHRLLVETFCSKNEKYENKRIYQKVLIGNYPAD